MTIRVWLLVVAALLVVVAALLVTAEAAIGRVSRTSAEEMADAGKRGSASLLAVLDDRARHVNVLLFCHQAAAVGAIVLVTTAFLDTGPPAQRWWHVLLAFAVMVLVVYVVLGVAPRTVGVQQADDISRRAAKTARVLAVVLGPLASALIVVGNAVTPGKGYREGPFATQAELREMVDLAEASDVIEDDERQMIHSVFELSDTIVREVMVPRTEMVFIERHKTLRQALSLALRSGYSRIPVVGENVDDVVGVFYLKDVARRIHEHRDAEQSEHVDDLMRAPFFVPYSKQADDLLREMQAARVHLAIVVDEYGGTGGLVTIEDLVEEIVGEITDEYDTEVPEVVALRHGAYRVSARMHVDDFAALLGLAIDGDKEGVDTVAGLIARRLGRVPVPGARIHEDGWDLLAEAGEGRRKGIGTVLATPTDEQPDQGSEQPLSRPDDAPVDQRSAS